MTVEGHHHWEVNDEKYQVIQALIDKFEKGKTVIMGDMNGHKNWKKLLQLAYINSVDILYHTISEGEVRLGQGF